MMTTTFRQPDRPLGTPSIPGDVAQLGERLVCNQEVGGSIPLVSTLTKLEQGLSPIPFR